MILLLILLIASQDQLPSEAAAKLQGYRSLPALASSISMLGLIEEHDLGGRIAQAIAKEAYDAALRFDSAIEAKDFPDALAFTGGVLDIAIQARDEHKLNRERLDDPVLPFPRRSRTLPARCDHRAVDRAHSYLVAALEAGEFEKATETLRSSVELSEALEFLVDLIGDPMVALGVKLATRLSLATESRREFDEALRIGSLDRSMKKLVAKLPERMREQVELSYKSYLEGNQSNPACGKASEENKSPNLTDHRKMREKFIATRWADSSGYEYLQGLIELYRMEQGEGLSGSQYLDFLIRDYRAKLITPPPPPKR
jgi:hypothetical protein